MSEPSGQIPKPKRVCQKVGCSNAPVYQVGLKINWVTEIDCPDKHIYPTTIVLCPQHKTHFTAEMILDDHAWEVLSSKLTEDGHPPPERALTEIALRPCDNPNLN